MKKTIVATLGVLLLSASGFAESTASTQAGVQTEVCLKCLIQEWKIAVLRELSGEKINEGLPVEGQSIIGDFIRYKDGGVKARITQYEAQEECERRGSRLPTAREFAQEAVRLQKGKGPGGVDGVAMLECDPNQSGCQLPLGFAKKDFYKVTSNENGKTDTFYYSRHNYERPQGDLGNYWTWSSSLHPVSGHFARYFYGVNGHFVYVARDDRDDVGAARCVVGGAGEK